MKVLVWLPNEIATFAVQPNQLSRLAERCPQHSFRAVENEQEFVAALPDAEAAFVWRFDAAWYALGPQLRFVATPAAGRELVAPDPSGRVRSVHGHFHGKIMGETLLAMMLHVSRRFDICVEHQRLHRYARDSYVETRRLAGQHALIVGYGPLGRECARLLKGVGLRVTGLKRNAQVDPTPADAVVPAERLHELLPQVDHVVLTLPSDTGTDHLLGARELELMRPSACVYNLGRGNAIDEAALLSALRSGRIAHAFLDVFEQEPLPTDSPLWDAPHLSVLPHASAISREYLDLWFEELAAEQL
ncbi:MAG TPA: D-2-hydroxyacid dehydrogenase [Polyangiaceae bacterium]|nr:D-2-hydroxyacid dehydrogenase [Polyangiaceae bacterium]